MKLPASVEGRDALRLFLALRLPDEVLDALLAWQAGLDPPVGVRLVQRDQLHVTLAFLGRTPLSALADIVRELREAAGRSAGEIRLVPKAYRETRSVGMILLADEEGRAAELAGDVHERLERLGVYERERRPWLAHVTVLRHRRPTGLEPELPPLGTFSPSGAAAYHSVLRPTGAQYEVLESIALGGH